MSATTVAPTLSRPATRHPPSNGAHRLAWWLAPLGDAGFEHLCAHAEVSFELIDRLLAGQVEPSEEIAAAIARETEGEVLPDDWHRGGPLGWAQRPPARPTTDPGAWLQTR